MFDLERYLTKSTEKSGVPLKVSDKDTLLNVASQLSQGGKNGDSTQVPTVPRTRVAGEHARSA